MAMQIAIGNLEKEVYKIMENNEVIDSGIVGYSELEELEKQLEEKDRRIKELEEENNDLSSDLDFANIDLENTQERLQEVIENYSNIKCDVMVAVATRLTIDGLITPELEEWLENFNKFYLKDI